MGLTSAVVFVARLWSSVLLQIRAAAQPALPGTVLVTALTRLTSWKLLSYGQTKMVGPPQRAAIQSSCTQVVVCEDRYFSGHCNYK